MEVDVRGEQETQKQFVEGGVETREGTLEELKSLIKVSRVACRGVRGLWEAEKPWIRWLLLVWMYVRISDLEENGTP